MAIESEFQASILHLFHQSRSEATLKFTGTGRVWPVNLNRSFTMNKIILGLIAAASISTAALANERTDIDPRDRNQSAGVSVWSDDTAPLLVSGHAVSKSGLTAFERVQAQSAENENSGN